MRITAGTYGGRVLKSPKNKNIRPTADKVRQAIFNILLSYDMPSGAQVLDGFCGSGALGLEAVSRGAAHCVFVDKSPGSFALCKENIAALSLPEDIYRVIKADLTRMRPRRDKNRAANLVFLDPPYGHNLIVPALESLAQNGWLAPGAFCVVETETDSIEEWPEPFTACDDRVYGQTRVRFARYQPQGS